MAVASLSLCFTLPAVFGCYNISGIVTDWYLRLASSLVSPLFAAACHFQGIIHRGITLGSFLVTRAPEGELRVKLCDFGSAVAFSPCTGLDAAWPLPATPHTADGWTPSGMPPEASQHRMQW